ncbi:MAG: ABC transporter ATP-binding protein [Rhodospirillaceae bacterium]|jgi:iron(III) transport system ATP-binding protein|nr:ABC transporter ATP-binding protein [Rhodospirillaceae bacterium]
MAAQTGAAEAAEVPAMELRTVRHAFGGLQALDGVDLAVEPGEVVCIVGPSGCGKTTLLRLVAGLEVLQEGEIVLGGQTVALPGRQAPPEARGIGLVFQDFALFPHLSVTDNVGFGLRRWDPVDRRARVLEVLEQFAIGELVDAFPHTLSGGQMQRVALARAIAPRPRLLLLDEPFSGLDSRLRDAVRDRTLHDLKESGAATLMVTHDPEEAMFMADRIAVMRAGHIEQVGRPVEIYYRPASAFVTAFFSDVNRLQGVVRDGAVSTLFGALPAAGHAEGAEVQILIRPEALQLAWAGEGDHAANIGLVRAARLLGRSTLVHLDMPRKDEAFLHLHSRVARNVAFGEGDEVAVTLDQSQAFVFAASEPISEPTG